MADLLSSLIRPSSSEDSFHSTHSTHHPTSPLPPHAEIKPKDPVHLSNAAQNQVRQPVYEVNAYLNDSTNNAFLESGKRKNIQPDASKPGVQSPTTSSDASHLTLPVPVQLGSSKSSHHVSALNTLCQEKGLTPEFDIQKDLNVGQRFKGTLTVGGQTIRLEESHLSKKEAKQALAEKAYEIVNRMEARVKRKDDDGDGTENWIGKLLEFHTKTALPSTPAPSFTDYGLGLFFACECTIAQSPTPFGSRTTPFPSKRLAKTAAAKAAVAYLISTGHLSPTGTILSPKKGNKNTAVKGTVPSHLTSSSLGREDNKAEEGKSWPQRVSELYPLLGLCSPVYRLEPKDPVAAPNIFSGAAYFPGDLLVEGPVGEIRGVFGKKNAKEECAKGVWIFLDGLRRKRLAGL